MYMCMCIYYIHTYNYVHTYISSIPSVDTSHLPHSVGWCSDSPSDVELALETTFTHDKKHTPHTTIVHISIGTGWVGKGAMILHISEKCVQMVLGPINL